MSGDLFAVGLISSVLTSASVTLLGFFHSFGTWGPDRSPGGSGFILYSRRIDQMPVGAWVVGTGYSLPGQIVEWDSYGNARVRFPQPLVKGVVDAGSVWSVLVAKKDLARTFRPATSEEILRARQAGGAA